MRSEHIITCRGSLEWKQSLQVAKKQMQLTPDRKGFTCKVISAISHLQLFRKSLGGTGRTVANICVFCLRHACTGKCVLGCSNLQKMQTVHISLTASRHNIEPSISTSHLIRHHLKVLSYSVCGKVLPKKMAQRSESVWMTDVSILCKTVLVKSHVKLLTARHKLYPQDQSLNGYGMKHAALPTRECCRIICYTYNIRLCMNLNCGIGIWSLYIYIYRIQVCRLGIY